MMNIQERVAYLHGLTKGLDVDGRTPEGKAILHIIDVLEDMADDIQHVNVQQQELETYMTTIDEDLSDLEEDFYEEFDVHGDQDFVEMQCPSCHEEVSFASALLDEEDSLEVTCPHCGAVVYEHDGDAREEERHAHRRHAQHGHYIDQPGL